MDKEIMKGSIDILLLSMISSRDMYGYEIVKVLKEKSDDAYNMSEGTLYPALKRLEIKKWLESYWAELPSGGRRKYYRMTDDGRSELNRKLGEWDNISNLIKRVSEGLV